MFSLIVGTNITLARTRVTLKEYKYKKSCLLVKIMPLMHPLTGKKKKETNYGMQWTSLNFVAGFFFITRLAFAPVKVKKEKQKNHIEVSGALPTRSKKVK